MPSKTLIQFPSERFTLTGTWDWPDTAASKQVPAVIFCHGFTGHRIENRRLYVRLAHRLAAAGIASFRFDHRGCGESTGDFINFTPAGLLADLDVALELFLSTPGIDLKRLGMMGYSLGGASATYLTTRHPSFQTAALWAAVAQPEVIRDRLASYPNFHEYQEKGYFDYFGFRVSAEYIDGIADCLKPIEWITPFRQPILAVQGLSDPIVKPEQLNLYRNARNHPEDKFVLVPDADHGFSTAEQGDEVVACTSQWFQQHLLQ